MRVSTSCIGWVMGSAVVAGVALAFVPGAAAQVAPGGQWPTYGGDLGSTRYAPLDQIDASNFSKLEVAWRFGVANLGPTPEYVLQSTPLVVDGVLYTTGGTRRAVTALDAATGEQLWVYSVNEGQRGLDAPRKLSGRGLAFWQRGRDKRVMFVTPGYQLVAVDAATGRPAPSFGKNGIVDLRDTLEQGRGWDVKQIGTNSPPTVVGDVVIVGAAHTPFAPAGQPNNVIGYIRAFDAATGRLLWTFHTIPRRGEPGFETWLDGSALEGGGAGHPGGWGPVSRICPWNHPTATCTAACARARISTGRASSPWI
jgi:quinoprotein glucose dehydrogenase